MAVCLAHQAAGLRQADSCLCCCSRYRHSQPGSHQTAGSLRVWSSEEGSLRWSGAARQRRRREGGEREVGCVPTPPCDHLGIVCRCWGAGGGQEPGTCCNEHNLPVPGAFLWVSYLSGLGALGEGGARSSHRPSTQGAPPPMLALAFQGHGQSQMWTVRRLFLWQSCRDSLFSLLFSLPRT